MFTSSLERVYRNETNLNMHLDKSSTHIISSILHVDHGEDDEPWPIVIEDFHGNTNEVYLESGDMLFYESSKCFHGRPAKMNGEYYSSLFTHYYPKEWNATEVELDVHYRIPRHWAEVVARPEGEEYIEKLDLVETSVKEPECPDAWCGLKNTKKWYGPAPGYGNILSGGGIHAVEKLENIPTEDSFEKHERQNIIDEIESNSGSIVERSIVDDKVGLNGIDADDYYGGDDLSEDIIDDDDDDDDFIPHDEF